MRQVEADKKTGRLGVVVIVIIILVIIGCLLPDDGSSSSSYSSSHTCDVCGSSGAKQYKSTVGGSYLSSGYYCSSCVSKRKSMGIEMTRI